jgi:hypothetical protein
MYALLFPGSVVIGIWNWNWNWKLEEELLWNRNVSAVQQCSVQCECILPLLFHRSTKIDLPLNLSLAFLFLIWKSDLRSEKGAGYKRVQEGTEWEACLVTAPMYTTSAFGPIWSESDSCQEQSVRVQSFHCLLQIFSSLFLIPTTPTLSRIKWQCYNYKQFSWCSFSVRAISVCMQNIALYVCTKYITRYCI